MLHARGPSFSTTSDPQHRLLPARVDLAQGHAGIVEAPRSSASSQIAFVNPLRDDYLVIKAIHPVIKTIYPVISLIHSKP